MKVALLGATGRTGRLVLNELLARGHGVAVLARDPASADLPAGIDVVRGDVRDRAALERVLAGADAVVSTLGPRQKDRTLHREAAPLVASAMSSAGVRRFVGISGAGIDVPGDAKALRDRVVSAAIQRLGGDAARDKTLEYETWRASTLDWTLVRPPRIVDGGPTGRLEHDAHRSPRTTKVTRGDLARFLVDTVETSAYVGEAPLVGSP